VLGEVPRALWMHFTAVPRLPPIRVRPAVVEGLAMECNISGPFMEKIRGVIVLLSDPERGVIVLLHFPTVQRHDSRSNGMTPGG
jgi:hypothetical protein